MSNWNKAAWKLSYKVNKRQIAILTTTFLLGVLVGSKYLETSIYWGRTGIEIEITGK